MLGLIPPYLLIPCYAETHFRFFPGFPSLLFRRWPEVIFDMPRRLAPGQDLPLALVLNDIDRFPVIIESLDIVVTIPGKRPELTSIDPRNLAKLSHPLDQRCTVFVIIIPRAQLRCGIVHVNAKAVIRSGKRTQIVLNDNLPGASHLCLSCNVCDSSLPMQHVCAYGDIHTHSQFSESHVEFGLPIQVIGQAARSFGLDFTAITDHSYDLCTSLDNYHRPDQTLPRWNALHEETTAWQSGDSGTVIVAGEEVSCLNQVRNVVHTGVLGNTVFIPGSLDGARKGRRGEPQLSIPETAARVNAENGAVFAAHPGAHAGFLQRALLKRGAWSMSDLMAEGIHAAQIPNGSFGPQWQRGKRIWVQALLRGKKLALVGGNDAHGDLGRYRCIRTPFVSILELFDRYFGFVLTGVYGAVSCPADIVRAVREGRTFATSGPFLTISTDECGEHSVVSSCRLVNPQTTQAVFVVAKSTVEFGPIRVLTVYYTDIGSRRERVVFRKNVRGSDMQISGKIQLVAGAEGYVRAEVTCAGPDRELRMAATSPCWIEAARTT